MLISAASVTDGIEDTLLRAAGTGQAGLPAARLSGQDLTPDVRHLLAILSDPPGAAAVTANVIAGILATARRITPLAGLREPAIYVALDTGTPGVFRTSPQGALTERIAGHDVVRRLHESYAPAPALLLVCDTISDGPAAYQHALLSAGALGYSAWLAARHRGLNGRLFPDASALATTLARTERHLFTVALGRPAPAPAPDDTMHRKEVTRSCESATLSAATATDTPPGICGSSKRCASWRPARTSTSRRRALAWST